MTLELPIHTDRLVLRTHQPDDFERLLETYGDPDVARYLPFDAWTRESAGENLAKRMLRTDYAGESGSLGLVFTLAGSDEYAGDVLLFPLDSQPRTAQLGWVTHPAHVRNGYAAEAASVVIRLAFEHYDLHRVIANLDARNTASARLCEKLGLRHEAHHVADYWSKGEWSDTSVYALLADEYAAGAGT